MNRLLMIILAAIMLAGLLYTTYVMSHRVAAFNAEHAPTQWAFKPPLNVREFTFGGRPVSLTDTTGPDGSDQVLVKYGEKELRLTAPVKPGNPQLPGLIRHEDWMKVFRFAEYGKRTYREFLDKLEEGTDRIVIVVKRPLIGPDPRTGSVWDRDWMFDFHELKADGTIESEGLKLPKTKGDKTPKPTELKVGTWQLIAALQLMPRTPPDALNVGRPTAAFQGDAMKSMGWTLPVGTALTIGIIVAIVLAALPRRQKSAAIR